MNLFESQIEKLNLSPTAKNCVIELRKVCLEGVDGTEEKSPMEALSDTMKVVTKEVSDTYYNENIPDAQLPELVYTTINKYRPAFEGKYGKKMGLSLVMAGKSYLHQLKIGNTEKLYYDKYVEPELRK